MNGKIARSIAVAATGSLLLFAGSGVAAASAVDSAVDGSSGSSSTVSAASQVSEVHNEIAEAAEAGDLTGTTAGVERAEVLLDEFGTTDRYNLSDEVTAQARAAQAEASEVAAELEQLEGAEPRLLDMLGGLVQSLLMALVDLVDAILGGGFDGADLPIDELPELPDDDLVDVPDEDVLDEAEDEVNDEE
ncbi:hypothetical protein [Haloechinothrix sp. LS1_15]|uniref:hypothetical protein n=1 Tax=Haloechinothrix sp. LS1_15 TaxID=2652248 RepID=UPI00294637F0|nr:hypothetical protein [Haloechinothrix sp. LS1_15]MDV6011309.1 hypothetical protein [Haloechinothrix sp. LS1_15]